MVIADAQVHIWAASTPARPWPAKHNAPDREVPFSKDDLLRDMDATSVHRAVIVPPSWEGERNDLGLQAASLHPDRLAVMGRLDINATDARSRIATWREQPGMLGLRLTFRSQAVPASDNWLWVEAETAGVPIMVGIYGAYAAQMRAVEQAALRHPALKLVICHLGIQTGKQDNEAFADLDNVLTLAKLSNVAVNATSLPSYTTDSYPYSRLHPHIRRIYDAFGPKRMFWGTDRTRLRCSYRQAVTMFTEEIPWLSADDKVWIMGRGLCEWLGWELL